MIDHGQQQGGFERPPDGMEAKQCPRCGSSTSRGFGLMGGGYGPYVFCENDCGWYYKEQEGELEARVIPDSVYSVIVRYVPIYEGGPRHDLISACDRCGIEWHAQDVGRRDVPGETFMTWVVEHRKDCKKP